MYCTTSSMTSSLTCTTRQRMSAGPQIASTVGTPRHSLQCDPVCKSLGRTDWRLHAATSPLQPSAIIRAVVKAADWRSAVNLGARPVQFPNTADRTCCGSKTGAEGSRPAPVRDMRSMYGDILANCEGTGTEQGDEMHVNAAFLRKSRIGASDAQAATVACMRKLQAQPLLGVMRSCSSVRYTGVEHRWARDRLERQSPPDTHLVGQSSRFPISDFDI
jgi:hypothetical protein